MDLDTYDKFMQKALALPERTQEACLVLIGLAQFFESPKLFEEEPCSKFPNSAHVMHGIQALLKPISDKLDPVITDKISELLSELHRKVVNNS